MTFLIILKPLCGFYVKENIKTKLFSSAKIFLQYQNDDDFLMTVRVPFVLLFLLGNGKNTRRKPFTGRLTNRLWPLLIVFITMSYLGLDITKRE